MQPGAPAAGGRRNPKTKTASPIWLQCHEAGRLLLETCRLGGKLVLMALFAICWLRALILTVLGCDVCGLHLTTALSTTHAGTVMYTVRIVVSIDRGLAMPGRRTKKKSFMLPSILCRLTLNGTRYTWVIALAEWVQ